MSGVRVRSLGVEAVGRPAVFEWDEGDVPPGAFRVRTMFSGLSAGTELTFVKGTNPYLHARWDAHTATFRHGEPGRTYPVTTMGYMEVGQVVESCTAAAAIDDVVAMAYGHKSFHTVPVASQPLVRLPEPLDPLLGIYAAQMGPICANGLLHAAHDAVGPTVRGLDDGVRGRRVLVVGAGVIGLLTALFALQYGAAEVAVADRTPARLEAAAALGATPLDESRVDVAAVCKQRWVSGAADRGADVVFQCRGRTDALVTALRSLRPQGTVIDLAFYQDGAAELRLGEEFHHNGLSIRCAQIGRVPRGLSPAWDRARLATETIALLRSCGDLIRTHLISEVVSLDEAPQLLADIAARRRHVIQAVIAFPPS